MIPLSPVTAFLREAIAKMAVITSLLVLASGAARASVVNFDFDNSQADVEVFPGVTANTTVDLIAKARVETLGGIWMEMRAKTGAGATASGHVNSSGLGVVGDPGANQISGGETVTLSFFDAATAGSAKTSKISRIRLANFGGTAGSTDGITVSTGALADFSLSANTSATGSGWTYTQFAAGDAQGNGEIVFNPAITVSSLVLTDNSTGDGGSRLQQIEFEESIPDPAPSAPNIVFVIVDDMGYSDIGCYGGEIDTPNIDLLADEGLRFRQFYNNAKCETSRSCLLSGLYHGRSGLQVQNGATLAEAARSGGYRTYAIGKWHMGDDSNGRDPTNRGFHRFYGIYAGSSNYFPSGIGSSTVSLDTAEAGNFTSPYPLSRFSPDSTRPDTLSKQTSFPSGYYMTDAIGDHAVSFINESRSNHPERPFFLYLAFNAPHTPLQAPVALINKYRNTYKTKGWDVLRQEKWQRQIDLGIVDPKWQLSNYREDVPRWDDLTAADQDLEDHRRAVYAAMVDSVDQNIGKVLARLDALGIADDTLVMFCSDNGAQSFDKTSLPQRQVSPDDPDSQWNPGAAWSAYSNTPFRYHKQSQHNGGNCSPFIARWPGVISPGEITDEPGHLVDIMATLVDIGSMDYGSLTTPSGATAPPMDGQSLKPVFEGTGRPAPDYWGFEFEAKDMAVIQGDWKLVSFRSSPWRLFNLSDDRTEVRNLARDYPSKVQAMATLYDEWASDTYGDNTRTYANRKTIPNLGDQTMRYENLNTGDFYSDPPVGVMASDIGTLPASVVSELHEVWTVKSSGSRIGGADDVFNLTSLPFFGDGEILVRIESFGGATGSSGLAGIMIRASSDADSPFVMTAVNPSGQCSQILRASAGTTASSSGSATFTAPLFLRLKRSGNTFVSSASADGLSWTEIASQEIALAPQLTGGLATASGSTSNQATVVYREWEHLDLGQYPGECRLIDGIPAILAYSFGADPDTPAFDRLPKIQKTNGSPSFPELVVHRRLSLGGISLGIEESETLSGWQDDTANWSATGTTALLDGISERVILRRNSDTTTPSRDFFRVKAE